jgi:transcriptional regulator with XRE-family HTH domain
MGKLLSEKIAELSPGARARVAKRTADLVSEELAIRDIRKAMQKTQVQIARELDIGQVAVSRIEQRSDLMISTLRNYLKAFGADLELRAVFKDRPAMKIAGFSELHSTSTKITKRTTKTAVPLTRPQSMSRPNRRALVEA